jgi:hypothetical protein
MLLDDTSLATTTATEIATETEPATIHNEKIDEDAEDSAERAYAKEYDEQQEKMRAKCFNVSGSDAAYNQIFENYNMTITSKCKEESTFGILLRDLMVDRTARNLNSNFNELVKK